MWVGGSLPLSIIHIKGFLNQSLSNVTGFGKTDHIVTIDISRNTDLKY